MHDLARVTSECKIDQILDFNKMTFESFDQFVLLWFIFKMKKGYDGCAHCLNECHSK